VGGTTMVFFIKTVTRFELGLPSTPPHMLASKTSSLSQSVKRMAMLYYVFSLPAENARINSSRRLFSAFKGVEPYGPNYYTDTQF
jgi:hypothetical protein